MWDARNALIFPEPVEQVVWEGRHCLWREASCTQAAGMRPTWGLRGVAVDLRGKKNWGTLSVDLRKVGRSPI